MMEAPWLIDGVWLIPVVGLLAGCLAGLIGVGGGILITPFLISLGIPARFVAGTMPMVAMTNAFSTLRHLSRHEQINLPLGGLLGIGGACGGVLGTLLVRWLQISGDVDRMIEILFIPLLLIAVVRLFLAPDRQGGGGRPTAIATLPLLRFSTPLVSEPISFLPLFLLGILIGAASAIMGIGGAIFMTPALIFLLRLDIKQASALAVIYIFITATANAVNHAVITGNSDLLLGLLLMPTGALGVAAGVYLRTLLPLRRMNWVYAVVLLSALAQIVWKVLQPAGGVAADAVTEPMARFSSLALNPWLTALLSLLLPLVISLVIWQVSRLFSVLPRRSKQRES